MKNFITENKQGYSIVTMNADKLDAQTTPELRSELVVLTGSNVSNIILDLTSCNYFDTTGLSAIMIGHRLCKNGHLILVGCSNEIKSMLSIQRFDPELVFTETLSDAESHIGRL